jgi:hypothetical protein
MVLTWMVNAAVVLVVPWFEFRLTMATGLVHFSLPPRQPVSGVVDAARGGYTVNIGGHGGDVPHQICGIEIHGF